MRQSRSENNDENIYVENPSTGLQMPFPKEKINYLPPQITPTNSHVISPHDTKHLWTTNRRGNTAHKHTSTQRSIA